MSKIGAPIGVSSLGAGGALAPQTFRKASSSALFCRKSALFGKY